jgi:hypothetical protein
MQHLTFCTDWGETIRMCKCGRIDRNGSGLEEMFDLEVQQHGSYFNTAGGLDFTIPLFPTIANCIQLFCNDASSPFFTAVSLFGHCLVSMQFG